jgi:GNAT superfamily N-acetyltransferase
VDDWRGVDISVPMLTENQTVGPAWPLQRREFGDLAKLAGFGAKDSCRITCWAAPLNGALSLREGESVMSLILHDLSAPALVTAIETNLFETYQIFHHWPRAEVYDGPDMLWMVTDIPSSMFNKVFRAQLASDNVDAVIEAVIARCRSRNVPLAWHVGPATRPANLGQYLEAYGFTHTSEAPGMAVDLLALNEGLQEPPGLLIERAADVETLKQFCYVFKVGFGWPDFVEDAWLDLFTNVGLGEQGPMRHYLGRLKGEPVVTMSLSLGASVAGIYCTATVLDARRQGIGTAMTLALLREARGLGYRVGILQSSQMGFSVYHKVGFREYCKQGSYEWRGETEQSRETTAATSVPK